MFIPPSYLLAGRDSSSTGPYPYPSHPKQTESPRRTDQWNFSCTYDETI